MFFFVLIRQKVLLKKQVEHAWQLLLQRINGEVSTF